MGEGANRPMGLDINGLLTVILSFFNFRQCLTVDALCRRWACF
ncbi:hypothetical protein EA1_01847 [Moraxella catarrhalis O35E]|nr:hypothetical protein EA1_01847 [Moraxella catarrhalis O35E]